MRDLTPSEMRSLFGKKRCPFCGCTKAKAGPIAGASHNIFCSGCGAGFNIVPGIPELGGQLIKDPAEVTDG